MTDVTLTPGRVSFNSPMFGEINDALVALPEWLGAFAEEIDGSSLHVSTERGIHNLNVEEFLFNGDTNITTSAQAVALINTFGNLAQ